jgi:hypothetical protein
MRLYTSGVKPPKLGTVQDKVIRQFMTSESDKETKKVQILALLAVQTLPAEDDRVKKIWKSYLGLEYGIEIPEHTDHEKKMMDYYDRVVKKLKPSMFMKQGKLIVSGLDDLRQ